MKQITNEYIVEFEKKKNIANTLPKESRNELITPAVNIIFSMFEILGISACAVNDEKIEVFKHSSDKYRQQLVNQLGEKYLNVMTFQLYRLLKMLGVKYFKRNDQNKKWVKIHKQTDQKLELFLNESINPKKV